MPEIVEVEVRQASGHTGGLKGVPDGTGPSANSPQRKSFASSRSSRSSSWACGFMASSAVTVTTDDSHTTREFSIIPIELSTCADSTVFAYRRGYEETIAAGRWVRREERVALHDVAEHRSDCTAANFDKRSFTRRFLVDHGPAGPMLVDDTPPPWAVLGWAGPFTFLGSRQCVTCADWELSLSLRWPELWEDLSPWVTAFLSRTTITPL